MSKKVPKILRVVLNPTDSSPATLLDAAEYYLCSAEVRPLDAYQAAVSCLLGPLGKAISGCSQAEVEEAIAVSRTQFETFMALARSRCRKNFDNFSKNSHLGNIKLTAAMTHGHCPDPNSLAENLDLENERL